MDKDIPIWLNLEDILEHKVDILMSVQYHAIIEKVYLDHAGLAINLHMAPLPEYRGCNQFTHAVLDEVTEFGTTIHKMIMKVDAGDILCERRFPIGAKHTAAHIRSITVEESIILFRDNIAAIVSGELTGTPQADAPNHLRDEIHVIKNIDLTWPKERIERHILSTIMPGFSPPFIMIGGRKMNIVEAVDG